MAEAMFWNVILQNWEKLARKRLFHISPHVGLLIVLLVLPIDLNNLGKEVQEYKKNGL